jgi:hypothetical protein
LPKKGDKTDYNNWRHITLLNVASKIFGRCIFTRIQIPIKTVLRQNQAGFRIVRSCADMTFVLRTLIEELAELQKSLFINFIDSGKAFDSVFRTALWEIMREYGIPENIIKMVRILYDRFECAVVHEGKSSLFFAVEKGVKQGCLLSRLLFLLVVDLLMRKSVENQRDGCNTGVQWVEG